MCHLESALGVSTWSYRVQTYKSIANTGLGLVSLLKVWTWELRVWTFKSQLGVWSIGSRLAAWSPEFQSGVWSLLWTWSVKCILISRLKNLETRVHTLEYMF